MDPSLFPVLQTAIEKELSQRFGSDESAMAEYVVVMLQNGKDAQGITSELSDLLSNYDPTFTDWIFQEAARLQADPKQPTGNPDEDQNMQEDQLAPPVSAARGMNPPSANSHTQQQSSDSIGPKVNHNRPKNGSRSSPYGAFTSTDGTSSVPKGPRARGNNATSGPVRTPKNSRHNQNPSTDDSIPQMPQFPGFPMPPAEFFQNLPLAMRMAGPSANARAPSRRCTKWPTCSKGRACTFGHPVGLCQNTNCRRQDGTCVNIHADENIDLSSALQTQEQTEVNQEQRNQAKLSKKPNAPNFTGQSKYHDGSDGAPTPLCKFGESCTNRSCHFSHPSPASKNGSSIVLNAEFCPAAIECTDEQCTYSHPSPSNKYSPGVRLNDNRPKVDLVPCKFFPCLNANCRFSHDEGQKSAPKSTGYGGYGGAKNKVWTPQTTSKSTAERSFVAEEVEEQFTDVSNLHANEMEMEK